MAGTLKATILGLDALFHSRDPVEKGFRQGSTVLIAGPPGAGKTTFSLALARSLIAEQQNQPKHPRSILFFLSLEVTEKHLKEIYEPMGWFDENDRVLKLDARDKTTMRVVSVHPAFDRPVATSEEVINGLFSRMVAALDPGDKCDVFVIVDSISALARDSGTVLERRRQTHELKARLDTAISGTGSKLVLTMFLAERPSGHPQDMGAAVEEYLVDTVIRLDVQSEAMGRRLRTLEVMKSQGANMLLGEHTWAIISGSGTKDKHSLIFENEHYITEVRKRAGLGDGKSNERELHVADSQATVPVGSPRSDNAETTAKVQPQSGAAKSAQPSTAGSCRDVEKWGTVVIFPRSRSVSAQETTAEQGIGKEEHGASTEKKSARIKTGTLGLDQLLSTEDGREDHWRSATAPRKDSAGLKPGTTTLLVGPPGTGKSNLLLQFLFASMDTKESKGKSIYVSFDRTGKKADDVVTSHWERYVGEIFQTPRQAAGSIKFANEPDSGNTLPTCPVTVYSIRHSQIDLNLIIAQLTMAIREKRKDGLTRLALDGLSEWLSTCNRERDTGPLALEALLSSLTEVGSEKATFHGQDAPPLTLMLAYETPIGGDSFPKEIVSVQADNLLCLDQVHLAEATRRMIYVVKSESETSDRTPREIIFQPEKNRRLVEIRPGFDEHAGIIEGNIRQATVVLQLFNEYQLHSLWVEELVRKLKQFRDLSYKVLTFHSTEIARTLQETDSPAHFPPSDLRIMEADEWWIQNASSGIRPPLISLSEMWRPHPGRAEVSSWREFWFTELDKALVPQHLAVDDNTKELYAVPSTMDFSMCCVNIGMLSNGGFPTPLGVRIGLDARFNLPQPRDERPPHRKPGHKEVQLMVAQWTPLEEAKKARSNWEALMEHLPRRWIAPEIARRLCSKEVKERKKAFTELAAVAVPVSEPQTPATDLLSLACTLREESRFLFSADLSNPESCACLFYELAWAFGAGEDALKLSAGSLSDKALAVAAFSLPNQAIPFVESLFFVQLLVMIRAMPPGSDADGVGAALISRHWHSTLAGSRFDTLMAGRLPPGLLAIPYWPVAGAAQCVYEQALASAEFEMNAHIVLMRRAVDHAKKYFDILRKSDASIQTSFHAAVLEACGAEVENIEKLIRKSTPATPATRLKALVVAGRKIEKLFLAEPAGKSLRLALNAAMPRPSEEISHEEMDKIDNHMAKTVPGFVDLDEGWRLNCIRISILVHAAKDGDNPLLDALNGSADARLPSEAVVRKAAACLGKGYPSGKGLCTPACSGSWMYGVHRSSRSVSLARDLIHEMTSTVTVRQRAQDGSCIPPRKDFYQIWGDEPAVCAEHLTWWEYLRAGQAFARRRDRILPPGVEPAEIHKLSREMLMRCIEFAARNRVSRNITVSSKVTEIESERQALVTNLETAWMLAEQAVKEIVITVRNRSQQTPEATTQPA